MAKIEKLQKELESSMNYKETLLETKLYRECKDLDTAEVEAEIADVTAEIKAKRTELRTLLAK